jgi:pimeloyl-ACP methyl ester carboxylesterase
MMHHAPGTTPQSGFRSGYVSMADGLRMYYRDYGDPRAKGTPLLCLTGLARTSRDYHDLATQFSRDRRVICPDYIGRGKSARTSRWQRYRPVSMLGDIITLCTALNLHGIAVIGTSLGGFMTMGLSVMAPTLLKGAVLNDVGPDFGNTALARIIDYVGRDHPESDWDSAIATLKRDFPQLGFEDEADWRDMAEGTFEPGKDGLLHINWDPLLAETIKERSDGFDLWAMFRALGANPLLAFRGSNSDALKPETFQKMAETLPEMQAITVPNRAHVPALNEPECRPAIAAFLQRVDQKGMPSA